MRTLLLLSIWISFQWLVVIGAEYRPPLKTGDGFAVPQPGWHYELPRDYGSHPEFKIEWWYVTGHLFGEHDRRFGFQATFFRQAGPRPESEAVLTPASGLFDSRELHLAHVALLDVQTGRFIHEERLNRGGWDAESSESTLAVRNGNWSLLLEENAADRLNLHGSIKGDAAFSLHMTPAKPLVMFGQNGVSRKGPRKPRRATISRSRAWKFRAR